MKEYMDKTEKRIDDYINKYEEYATSEMRSKK